MNNRGLTLIEIMVVIAIVAMLATFALHGYSASEKKVKVEREIKALYANLQAARLRAFAEKRVWGITWSGSPFTSYEVRYDTDGDESITDSGGYVSAGTVSGLAYPITCNVSYNHVLFMTNGLSRNQLTFYVAQSNEAEYDCIAVSKTRIKMGKWNGSTCVKR